MNYFKALGLIFGLAAMLKPVYMHLLPWDENAFIAKAYAKERPKWVLGVALLGLCLVALTWYMHFTAEVQYSLVLTILFSLTSIKGIALILDYKRFHSWVGRLLAKDKGKDIVLVDIAASALGVVIVVSTLLLY